MIRLLLVTVHDSHWNFPVHTNGCTVYLTVTKPQGSVHVVVKIEKLDSSLTTLLNYMLAHSVDSNFEFRSHKCISESMMNCSKSLRHNFAALFFRDKKILIDLDPVGLKLLLKWLICSIRIELDLNLLDGRAPIRHQTPFN